MEQEKLKKCDNSKCYRETNINRRYCCGGCCEEHLAFTNQICPDCNLKVDEYGNTEDNQQYCSFPCCGCDGARVCYYGEPNEDALGGNIEGMWNNSDKKSIKGRMYLYGLVHKK